MNGNGADCHVALVLLIDTSGSMNEEVSEGGGATIMRRVKQAATSVIQTVLPDHWVCGLATFPNNGSPVWPAAGPDMMEMLTAANRDSLRQAIENLATGGSTNVISGMQLAGWMLETQDTLPRFLALFTDGNLVQGLVTEEAILNTATQLKNRGVFIITGGYTLSSGERDLLRQMASAPSAFIDTVTGSEIINLFSEEVSNLCRYVPVTVVATPPAFTVAANDPAVLIAEGGQLTGNVEVRWHFGEPGNFRLWVSAILVGVEIYGETQFALGPETPPVNRKFALAPHTQVTVEWDRSITFFARRADGAGSAGFAYVPVEVLPDSFELSWAEGPTWVRQHRIFVPWRWRTVPGRLVGKVRLTPEVLRPTDVRISILLRRPGSTSTETGWTFRYPISLPVTATSTDVVTPFEIIAPVNVEPGVRIVEASAVVFGLQRVISAEVLCGT